MQWKRTGETAMRCEPWTIARVTVRGINLYVLWHDAKPDAIGRYDTFGEARDAARREENRNNRGEDND